MANLIPVEPLDIVPFIAGQNNKNDGQGSVEMETARSHSVRFASKKSIPLFASQLQDLQSSQRGNNGSDTRLDVPSQPKTQNQGQNNVSIKDYTDWFKNNNNYNEKTGKKSFHPKKTL